MMAHYWTEEADYIYSDKAGRLVVGEDENGDLWVPRWRDDKWTRFNRYNPVHWLSYWNARRRNEVVFLEWVW